jgi:hypothetical protein
MRISPSVLDPTFRYDEVVSSSTGDSDELELTDDEEVTPLKNAITCVNPHEGYETPGDILGKRTPDFCEYLELKKQKIDFNALKVKLKLKIYKSRLTGLLRLSDHLGQLIEEHRQPDPNEGSVNSFESGSSEHVHEYVLEDAADTIYYERNYGVSDNEDAADASSTDLIRALVVNYTFGGTPIVKVLLAQFREEKRFRFTTKLQKWSGLLILDSTSVPNVIYSPTPNQHTLE